MNFCTFPSQHQHHDDLCNTTPASDAVSTGIIASLHHELGIDITMSLGGEVAAENLLIAAILTHAAGFGARLHHRSGAAGRFVGKPLATAVFFAFRSGLALNHHTRLSRGNDGWQGFVDDRSRITPEHLRELGANAASFRAPILNPRPGPAHSSGFEILAYFLALIVSTRSLCATAFRRTSTFAFVVHVARILAPRIPVTFLVAFVHDVDDFRVVEGQAFATVGVADGELVIRILGQHRRLRCLVLRKRVHTIMHYRTVVVGNAEGRRPLIQNEVMLVTLEDVIHHDLYILVTIDSLMFVRQT